jgi:type I restriction enzyme S subunit
MSFPRYPKYKDSGVEWLGEVPEHWEVDRFKTSVQSCRNGIWGGEAQENEDDVPCVRVADFDRQRLRVVLDNPTIRNVTSSERDGRLLSRGDLLLEKSGGGELQPVGCVVLYEDNSAAICSNFVARMQLAEGMVPSFWRYLHAAAYTVRLNTRSIKQTSGIQNLDQQQYLDERAAFPPSVEQTAIATFLDRETAKIDALIAEQQRFIELLQEKRQAVISHAVTKGLNPDAPMKDSGIEWLGEVPEHWAMKRLKHVSPYLTVGIVVTPSTYVTDDGLPFIYGGDIREGVIDWEGSRRISPESSCLQSKTQLRAGDLLMVRVGAPGVTAVVPPPCEGGNCASVMLIRQGTFSSQWLCYLLNTRVVRFQVEVVQYGAAQEQFNISHAVNFWMPVPPIEEQNQIAAALDAETNTSDSLIAEAQHAITLLQERRSALISAAVTGQIDVRGLAGSEAA